MKGKEKALFSSICVLWMIFVLAGSIALPILLRPFYYLHIEPLHLSEESGYTVPEIKEAYDDMMDFCVFGKGEFKTGVLPYSEEGKAHFEDCAVLFRLDLVLFALSAVLLVPAYIYVKKKKLHLKAYNHGPGSFAGYFLGFLFLMIGLLCALDFDAAFVMFHRIFFPGKTNWIFDWNKDQIIRVLPEQFFMNAGICIALMILLGCAALILYDIRRTKKQTSSGNRTFHA